MCRWRPRTGKAGRATEARTIVGAPGMVAVGVVSPGVALSPALRLAQLGLLYASGSPRVTIDELKDAIVRIWHDEEKGYFAEARFTPRSSPIYTQLTEGEAMNLSGPEPDPSLIAHIFERKEIVAE